MSRINARLLAACAGLALAATASTAAAQAPDVPDEPAAAPGVLGEIMIGNEHAGGDDATFDRWVFGNKTHDWVRQRLDEALARELARINQKYALTPPQKKKLELAGRCDIKRFFDRVEVLRAEYRRVQGDGPQIIGPVGEIQQAWQQPQSEVFGGASMLAKTLNKNLTAEQIAGYHKGIYRRRVEWMAGLLHSRLVLGPDQRKKLVNLVVEETPPLARYGNFDYDAIMYQLSRLPAEKIRAILDEGQCRELSLRFDQARRMESLLISEGYLKPARPTAGTTATRHEEARR